MFPTHHPALKFLKSKNFIFFANSSFPLSLPTQDFYQNKGEKNFAAGLKTNVYINQRGLDFCTLEKGERERGEKGQS